MTAYTKNSKELLEAVNYYHKKLHFACCSSPRSASGEDHPLNVKQGGVCIYYNISLPLTIKNIHYLQECIIFEIKTKEKL